MKGRCYPLNDRPTFEDIQALGINGDFNINKAIACPFTPGEIGIVCVKAGEFRPPLAGEWFLSGAIIEAYRTRNNFTTPKQIARLVVVKTEMSVTEISKLRVEQLTRVE